MRKNHSSIFENFKTGKTDKILKISLIGVFLIFAFWSQRGEIEDFLFFEIAKGKNFQNQHLEKYYENFRPFRNWKVENLEIKAEAAISAEIKDGSRKVLFEKNSKEILPIASLTKLMTAYIALENRDLEEKIEISKKAADLETNSTIFRAGESFYLKDLLHSLLMESSNVAAQSLSEIIGEEKFVELMNKKAKEFGLKNTHFSNPSGLDPTDPKIFPNSSTPEDLVILASNILEKKPLIFEISKTKEYELYETNGVFHHKIKNTNEILNSSFGEKVLGGKTGQTFLAGKCLLIVLEAPKSGILINVILGSPNHFQEMEKILNWLSKAYKW